MDVLLVTLEDRANERTEAAEIATIAIPGTGPSAAAGKAGAKIISKVVTKLRGNPKIPKGRELTEHAVDRMADPGKGRRGMTADDVDSVLDGATKVQKLTHHPKGDTLTIINKRMPGKPKVVVDAKTGQRIITVIRH